MRREKYLEWRDALEQAIFPALESAEPVYLAVDEQTQHTIEEDLGLSQGSFAKELASTVAAFLDLSAGPSGIYAPLNAELGRWKRTARATRGAPPVLPFLMLLTLAAEQMSAGDGMSEANFYGRVALLLKAGDDRRFAEGYRRFAEGYWGVLDQWLEYHDGLRGLPTAAAIGHRYVGLPISQVLIRKADRARLPYFFVKYGFPPGAAVSPAEIGTSFDVWIRSEPCPVSNALLHQWRSLATRQQILDVVAAALATWSGHLSISGNDTDTQCSLAFNISSFPKKKVTLSPVAYLPTEAGERSGRLRTAAGWHDVAMTPFAPGIVRIGQEQALDNKSLLEGLLEVQDSLTGMTITRHPRRLMVFRRVDMVGAFLEAEQVLLGEDVFIVARDEKRLLEKTRTVLEACARPGWKELPSNYTGVPQGWVVFRDIQMFAHPGSLIRNDDLDLKPLVPLTSNQLTVAGGFSLPGSVRGKWHVDQLPEIRAVSDDPDGFTVHLLDLADTDEDTEGPFLLESWQCDPGGHVVDLAELELDVGNYRVELQPSGAQRAVSSVTLRIRNGDSPDFDQLEKFDPAEQCLVDPLSVLGAGTAESGATLFGAALLEADPKQPEQHALSGSPSWQLERSRRTKSTLQIATVPPDSCLYTGSHRTEIEQVRLDANGRPETPYVNGTCKTCGLVRLFPSSAWRAKKRTSRQAMEKPSSARIEVSTLEPVVEKKVGTQWDIVLDAMFHCAAGNRSALEKLATQIEPSALMMDHLTRTLWALGHIEIVSDPDTLAPNSWEVGPSALVATRNGYFLAGHWPEGLVNEQCETDPSVKLSAIRHSEAPMSFYFDRLPDPLLPDLHVGTTALDIALQLPPLSAVVEALPRVPVASTESGVTHFDPATAKWTDATGMGAIGGYRIRGFRTDDVLRTRQDINDGTMALSNVYLSKHATALLWGHKPLMAYQPEAQTLQVPLGGNLPGLYERALVLASGLAPTPSRGILNYHDISPELAGHLAYLMTH